MTFTLEERTKIKAMLLHLIKQKHGQSGGHCGFLINELNPILEDLVKDGEITKRPTININQYFLTTK